MKRYTASLVCLGLLCAGTEAIAADSLADVFTEGTVRGEVRGYYFERDFDGDTNDRADLAAGTLLYYQTGELFGISGGVGYATSNDIGSDDDKDVYGLLATDANGNHDNYARFQEYFLQGNWFDTKIKIGAQEISSPFLNGHDIRMTPKTYRGLTVENNSVENLTLRAFYITDYMGWSDEDFLDMSSVAVTEDADDNPLMAGGLKYIFPVESLKLSSELFHYHMVDYFQSNYVKFGVGKALGDVNLYFNPSFLKQDSDGDEFAGEFDTTQYGFNTGAKAYGFDLTAFYARTDDDPVFAPWGDGKVIIQQINASGRADEDTYAAKLNYDFTDLGAAGLSAYVFYGYYDVDDVTDTNVDISETDFSIQYNFSGFLKGFSVRGRYAIIDYDGGTADDFNDFRIYLKYSFAFGGKKDA